MSDQLPVVYYSNGVFLTFKAEHAIQLRRERILSRPVTGIVPNGLQGGHSPPYSLSAYAVHIIAELNLAQFRRLSMKPEISLLSNKAYWEQRSAEFANTARELFVAQRSAELRKRHLSLPPGRNFSDEFDEAKMRLTISETTDQGWSSYDEHLIHANEVKFIVRDEVERTESERELAIYQDLYGRGFYVSSGMKFGTDFLAYMGDPVMYHSQYAILHVESDSQGLVELSKVDMNRINCLQRLTHTVNKTPLFTTVIKADKDSTAEVTYWTLPDRFYLNPESKNTVFELLEPKISNSQESNKVRRLD